MSHPPDRIYSSLNSNVAKPTTNRVEGDNPDALQGSAHVRALIGLKVIRLEMSRSLQNSHGILIWGSRFTGIALHHVGCFTRRIQQLDSIVEEVWNIFKGLWWLQFVEKFIVKSSKLFFVRNANVILSFCFNFSYEQPYFTYFLYF